MVGVPPTPPSVVDIEMKPGQVALTHSTTLAQTARRREQSVRARERQEARYREELADAIRQFLAFAPQQAKLADEIAAGAAAIAAQVGTGRVGRTKTIPVSERAALAARAYLRHRYTSYESELPDPSFEDGWDDGLLYGQVKAEAQVAVDEFLERHRRAEA